MTSVVRVYILDALYLAAWFNMSARDWNNMLFALKSPLATANLRGLAVVVAVRYVLIWACASLALIGCTWDNQQYN